MRGCSSRSLALSTKFYRCYPEILQTVSAKSMAVYQDETLSNYRTTSALQLADPEMPEIVQTLSAELVKRFSLGWSHYVTLLTIDNSEEHRFYELEAVVAVQIEFNGSAFELLIIFFVGSWHV